MRYVSTRGESPSIGFLDAVLAGLAPDGGLYVPERWPTFTPEEIAAFAGQPYAKVAATVIGKFVGDDLPAEDLREMCDEAYASFAHAAVAPLKQLAPAATCWSCSTARPWPSRTWRCSCWGGCTTTCCRASRGP
jgi:threonine synthase